MLTVSLRAKPIFTIATPILTEQNPFWHEPNPFWHQQNPFLTSTKHMLTRAEPILTQAKPILTRAKPISTRAKPILTCNINYNKSNNPFWQAQNLILTWAKLAFTRAKPILTQAKPILTLSVHDFKKIRVFRSLPRVIFGVTLQMIRKPSFFLYFKSIKSKNDTPLIWEDFKYLSLACLSNGIVHIGVG